MKYPYLKSAFYVSSKFEGVKEFYIIENSDDLKNLMRKFPQFKKSWEIIKRKIKEIVSDGYVALVTDIIPSSNCVEVYYENLISKIYNYDGSLRRVTVEELEINV